MVTMQINKLTKREKQILQHVAQGLTSIDIGLLLEISPHTVQQHRKNINKKMNFKNLAQWVNYAHELGLN